MLKESDAGGSYGLATLSFFDNHTPSAPVSSSGKVGSGA